MALLLLLALAQIAPAQSATRNQEVSPSLEKVREMQALLQSSDAARAEKVKEALADGDWYVRGEAARLLGKLGDKANAPALLPLVRDENWFVRDAALEALGALGEPSAATSMQQSLE
ncbi:MAG TPA: HEAT repeat domain-containing protein, partial [Blastocatellia bacterium]|nr:HEAT repeat domain-containing protein [Blastocatellia bacterium]